MSPVHCCFGENDADGKAFRKFCDGANTHAGVLEPSVDFAVVGQEGKEHWMPQPSYVSPQRSSRANELQVQRERLRQALVNGASLEDVVDLLRSMRVLLPKTARTGKFATAPK